MLTAVQRGIISSGGCAISTNDLITRVPQEPQMPTSQPMEVLLATNRWATQNLIEARRDLSLDKFHREFPLGPGSCAPHAVSYSRIDAALG